jgi:hypothetical protein
MAGTIPFPNGGGDGSPPERRSRMDLIIDMLFAALPAKTLEEIQDKFKAKGVNVTISTLEQALFRLRRHAEQYGWSVPHVVRGPNSDKRCYFAVLRDKKGDFHLISEHRAYSRHGFRGTVSHIANMGKNETVALRMLAQFDKSKVRREGAESLILDLEYVARKAKALLRAVNG